MDQWPLVICWKENLLPFTRTVFFPTEWIQKNFLPMAEIQKLYAGKLKPEDVLAAAEKVKADTPAGKSARFYANLYVGLWYAAEGDAKKVREHLTEAVEKYKVPDYMWDVGNAHLGMLKAKAKK